MKINPQGMKQICELILKREEMPIIDPEGKKEPYWLVLLPKGKLPEYDDALKVTVAEWTAVMGKPWPIRPKLKAVVK